MPTGSVSGSSAGSVSPIHVDKPDQVPALPRQSTVVGTPGSVDSFTSSDEGSDDERTVLIMGPGSPPESSTSAYERIMFDAIRENNFKVLKFVFDPASHDINCVDAAGKGLLDYAPNWIVANWLIEQGASVWGAKEGGHTPLLNTTDPVIAQCLIDIAAEDPIWLVSDPEIARMPLAERKACYVNQTISHTCALTRAVARANELFRAGREQEEALQVVNVLLENGAATGVFNGWKHTPLHEAVMAGNYDLVDVLLEAGASPNDFAYGHTPLIFNCADSLMAQKLIDHGADVTSQFATYSDESGHKWHNALEHAEWKGRDDVAAKIRETLAGRT